MRRLGLTRLELVIVAALIAAVAGIAFVVGTGVANRERMSHARRDVAELGALVSPPTGAEATDAAPPKTPSKKRPSGFFQRLGH